MNHRISIIIVTYNGESYMPDLLGSIEAQTIPVNEVIIIDNGSSDNTVQLVQESYPWVNMQPQGVNLDFARGYNTGIAASSGDIVLIVNQDMRLHASAVEELVGALDADPSIGIAAPKLHRLFPEGEEQPEVAIIDGMGVGADRKRKYSNWGEGQEDRGQYNNLIEPFALSGAAMCFRREALDDIAIHGGGGVHEYFDNSFVAYKEDVDLSYRMHHRGWKLAIVPQAIIEHKRTAKELKESKGLVADRKLKSLRIRKHSLKNQWFTLIKNEPLGTLIPDLPFILWYEFRKLVFSIIVEPSSLIGIVAFIIAIPEMMKKRKAIQSSSLITAGKLRSLLRIRPDH